MNDYYDDDQFDEPIEGYCVRCRESVEIEAPQPVWTRKGMPATRGTCPICAGTVFRMGKTHLHDESNRPEPVEVDDASGRSKGPKLQRDTAYVIYAEVDEEIAQQIAGDLENAGVAAWLHEHDENTAWAGGVHPALQECSRMVYVLSPAALAVDDQLSESLRFFKTQRKPVVIAQVEQAAPPDLIRRSPRFDFGTAYKQAFRQMIQALG